jgi:hypothetical protein
VARLDEVMHAWQYARDPRYCWFVVAPDRSHPIVPTLTMVFQNSGNLRNKAASAGGLADDLLGCNRQLRDQ